MLTAVMRRDRYDPGGAHWESWMRLAGDTTFHLFGGSGARPEMTVADCALALAAGCDDRLGRTVALAIATQSLIEWPAVLRYGWDRVCQALKADRQAALVVADVNVERDRACVHVAMAHAFCEIVAGSEPLYSSGARIARRRWASYRTVYDVTRDQLQCAADDAAACGWANR